MKVLITEDEEFLLTAIEFRLKKQGYEALFVSNDSSLITAIQQQKPDLVIIGADTPNLDVTDVVTTLKEENNPSVPIIIIAALEAGEKILQWMNLGVDDFLTKPFKPAELVLRVRRIFQERGLI